MPSLLDRYVIQKIHGQGLDRQVAVARDRVLGESSVLKFADADSSAAAQLREEGALLEDLRHPRLVVLLDSFVEIDNPDGRLVTGFATRWVDGDPLTRALQGKPLEARLAAFGQLLDAAAYLHRRGLLHLDIKPDNALFSEDPRGVVLLDLGSARPLDSGPGEAGGTLGYAAPEVLAGQAATVAADIYSLGAVLYELLTGRGPFQATDLSGLRRAVLAGDFDRVRIVQPNVPRELAKLAEDMLSLDVSRRPTDVGEVLQRLAAADLLLSAEDGVPPFVGRGAELERLGALLEAGARQVYVVGGPGSGRSAVIRRALRRYTDTPGRAALDLSQTDDALLALQRLAGCLLPDLVPPLPVGGTSWVQAVGAGLQAPGGFAGPVFMGRREEYRPDIRRILDELARLLEARGCAVLWAARSARPDGEGVSLELPPLTAEDCAEIGRFFGSSANRHLDARVRGAGGWPGALIRALSPTEESSPVIEASDLSIVQILSALPTGIPVAFVRALPAMLQQQIEILAARQIARWGEDRRLYLDRAVGEGDIEPQIQGQVLAVLAEQDSDDPLWTALAAARFGMIEAALSLFELARGRSERSAELEELCALLDAASQGGHRAARFTLAEIRESAGDLGQAAALLRSLPDRSAEEDLRLIRILRRLRQLPEAEALVKEDLGSGRVLGPFAARFWLELSFIHYYRKELDEMEAACDAAEGLDPSLTDGPALAMRLRLAVARLDKNQTPQDLEALVERVERHPRKRELSAAIFAETGRLLIRMGEPERAEPLFAQAVPQADREGDRRNAAGYRFTRAINLRRLGRGAEARKEFRDALQVAESLGNDAAEMRLQIYYNLTDLELSADRIPEARRYLERYEREMRAYVALAIPANLARGMLLRAQLLQREGKHQDALTTLAGTSLEGMPQNFLVAHVGARARSLLALGRNQETLDLLRDVRSPKPTWQALLQTMRGRALLGLGRMELADARKAIPQSPDPIDRFEAGEVLLASAGEDLDPDSFPQRRKDLDMAAKLVNGELSAQAATLRDRLMMGPGADLGRVVSLTEAMQDPQTFPAALAQLVTEALGAHRVLILLRIPGLGQQMSYTELTGADAAGISAEVLHRIQHPDDYWLAANAFDDPRLRETSHTVRTFKLKSLLAVAIPHGDRAVGALYVDDLFRAGRFGMEDVKMLRRLAKAVGEMLPLLDVARRRQVLSEPMEICGVLLSDSAQIDQLESALSMLRGRDQVNLLITGETGSGKTYIAKRIAQEMLGLNDLEDVPLHKGDPEKLVTRLSGTRSGDFTGAINRHGSIYNALTKRRALFLDEVQNLDENGQQILLPLLELPQRKFAGLLDAARALEGPLHVILGTNLDVSNRRWADRFREDLWYRMSAVHIHLPPLRERGSEVIYQYLAQFLEENKAPAPEEVFETSALHYLTTWRWPGNVRQLASFAHLAAIHYATIAPRRISKLDFHQLGVREESTATLLPLLPLPVKVRDSLDQVKWEQVTEALVKHGWKQNEAAAALGMTPSSINKLLARYNVQEYVKQKRRETQRAAGPRVRPPGAHS